MPKESKTTRIHSRIEIIDPALVKKLEAARNKLRPVPAMKPFLEMLVELGEQKLSAKPQPEGEQ